MPAEENFYGLMLIALLLVTSLLLVVEVVSLIVLLLELRERRRSQQVSGQGQMTPDVDALSMNCLPISAAVAPQPIEPQPEPQPPKLKLFLSWAAVQLAVRSGTVSEEDLDKCLFCTSVAELNLAAEYDLQWFERLHPVFVKAAKENRLVCNNERERYNATPTWMVNMLLKRNGYALLSCVDQMGTLEQIPMYSCVPSVSDNSLEVLWAAHPLRGNWRSCWGRSLEEIDAAFAEVGDEPEGPRANWMQEMNQPIIDEARRKFEKPGPKSDAANGDGDVTGSIQYGGFNNSFWGPRPESTGESGAFTGDDQTPESEEEDPADFWKKGRPQDEE